MILDLAHLLNQAQQFKHNLDTLRPFSDTQLQNLRQRFRIGYIQQTNALEGNTLTLSEVKVLLEDGITIGGKTVRELRETLNHGAIMTLL
jgi:Fic family protein